MHSIMDNTNPYIANTQCTQTTTYKAKQNEGKTELTLQVSGPVTLANRFNSYRYSNILTTARLGSVSSSTATPHSPINNVGKQAGYLG